MIIGFTKNTSGKITRILCKNFRHVIILFPKNKNRYTLVQVAKDGIRLFYIGKKEIKTLEKNGWIFFKTSNKNTNSYSCVPCFLSCVGFAKRTLGINNPFIWTPDQLHRYLTRHKKIMQP